MSKTVKGNGGGGKGGKGRPKGGAGSGGPAKRGSMDSYSDAEMADLVALRVRPTAVWSSGYGWMGRRGPVWEPRADAWGLGLVSETLRDIAYERAEQFRRTGVGDPAKLNKLLSTSKANTVTSLVRSRIEVRAEDFDTQPERLNCPNGVVNLRTGEVYPHTPNDLYMKVTAAEYHPGAVSEVWGRVLEALEPDVADWMQMRFGQAITGYTPADDKLLCLIGGGSNGKSTLLAGIEAAAGDYVREVSPKVITASSSEHTTSMTTLQGLRIALLEELPEGRHLNVARMKAVVGTNHITARRIAQNDITFPATHALFITSNYIPEVAENDHGTWRRLVRVPFPYKYVETPMEPGDRPLDLDVRARMRDRDTAEAVLWWLVSGARRSLSDALAYRTLPHSVDVATAQWRASTDVIQQFAEDCLAFGDDTYRVATTTLFEAFRQWLKDNGHAGWASRKFWGRWESSTVSQAVTEGRMAATDRRRALIGVRLQTAVFDSERDYWTAGTEEGA